METVICEKCGKELPKTDAVEYCDIYLCPDCAKKELTTCSRCGEVISYEDSSPSPYGHLCSECYDDLYG